MTTEPRTEAGRRLAESLRTLLPNMPLTWEGIDDRILAIEAEASSIDVERLEDALEATDDIVNNEIRATLMLEALREANHDH